MFRFCFYLLLLCCLSSLTFATSSPPNIKHVIYITLDGVRWQDLYIERFYFYKLWKRHNAIFYGAPLTNTTIQVASIPISLPSYQSQMSGAVQPCNGNGCGRIKVETFPEKLINQLKLAKKDVVVFSSWPTINEAFEHNIGTTFTNTGNKPVYDPETLKEDSVMADLNQKQRADHYPTSDDRYDKYTFPQALHYFEKYRPRFMWISLGDADGYAHNGDLIKYHTALTYYDDVIDKLMTTLSDLKLDKETLVIITTDHGRGDGIYWTSHGPSFPESKRTWAVVFNGNLKPDGRDGNNYRYSTLSIRPTIEAAFGIV